MKREVGRALLILALEKLNPSQTAKLFNCSNKKVYLWYHRTKQLIDEFKENSANVTDIEIERLLRKFLKDRQRSGAPLFYTPEQQCAIIAMATPREYDVESEFWTHRELAYISNKTAVTVNISKSTVGRILAEADLKPHRIKYWEFPKIEDRDLFDMIVAEICSLYREAENNLKHNIHTISVDEKPGMQALERINPDKNAVPGKTAKFEFEYSRHGTQALIPSFEVGTGRIITHRIGATRTAKDFAALIEDTINLDPKAEWIFIADQLNTHKSAELVKLLAKKLNIEDDLGEKGENGILKNLQTRKNFLSDKKHSILQSDNGKSL